MKKIKGLIIGLLLVILSGCVTTLFGGASKQQQQEVKEQIMESLTDYYKQPFKLLDFSYDYGSHSNPSIDCVFLYCKTEDYGIYHFKIQAVDNPIITMKFSIPDGMVKESIKPLIDSFKKSQLNSVYCSAFAGYYGKIVDNYGRFKQPYTKQTEKFCDNLEQTSFHLSRDYYLKHKDEYK